MLAGLGSWTAAGQGECQCRCTLRNCWRASQAAQQPAECLLAGPGSRTGSGLGMCQSRSTSNHCLGTSCRAAQQSAECLMAGQHQGREIANEGQHSAIVQGLKFIHGSGLGGVEVAEVGQEPQGCMQAMLQAGKAISAGLHPLQAQQRVCVLRALCGRGVTPERLRQPPHAAPVCAGPSCPLAGCCSTPHTFDSGQHGQCHLDKGCRRIV